MSRSHNLPGDRVLEEIQRFWDEDAPTYDISVSHRPRDPAVQAAWTAALARLLPPAPARVLDVGAGTGFLSLIAARLGHSVTAMDLSPQMLGRLEAQARAQGLEIHKALGPAQRPPGNFDAVIERHLLWTLPDPGDALAAWKESAPGGRLVLFESVWGAADPLEAMRSRARHALHRLRGRPPDHHGSYSDALRSSLPLGTGTPPARIVELATSCGWRRARLERLRDVEWAERQALPALERLVGVSPRFAVVAD
ncbi:MAG TPA: class I SAM-dependent methyltransferase [Acidimicrobiales bacterium]|nr:class I SAM-dependent methyltransferase [Acidimicrobiales bacterium]